MVLEVLSHRIMMYSAQAKQRGEKESHGRQREAWVARLFLNAPAMSGTAWEARLFLPDMERAGGGGRGRAMCAPPPTPFSPPPPPPPAEPQGEGRGGGEEGGRESHLAHSN